MMIGQQYLQEIYIMSIFELKNNYIDSFGGSVMNSDHDNYEMNKTRDFGCSCGKDYLSYAALFTHIKQKHGGKAPGPIIRPRSQRKRGRPRKNPAEDHHRKFLEFSEQQNGISNLKKNNIQSLDSRFRATSNQLKNRISETYKIQNQTHKLVNSWPNGDGIGVFTSFKKYEGRRGSVSKIGSQAIEKEEIFEEDNARRSEKKMEENFQRERNEVYQECEQSLKTIFEEDGQCLPEGMQSQTFIQSLQKLSMSDESHLLSIRKGFELLLDSTKKILDEIYVQQLRIFLTFIIKYLQQQCTHNLQIPIFSIFQSDFSKFIDEFLVKKVTELKINKIRCFNFQKQHPLMVLVFISNWLAFNQQIPSKQIQRSGQKLVVQLNSCKILSSEKSYQE